MPAVFWSRATVYKGDYHCKFQNPKTEPISKFHYHDYYEIVIYLGDAGIFKTKMQEYLLKRGDIALINMFETHVLVHNNTDYERFSIGIDPSLLLSFSTKNSHLFDIFNKESKNYPVFHLEEDQFNKYLTVLNQFKSQKLDHAMDIFEKSLIHQIVAYIYNDCFDGIHFDSTDSRHISVVAQLVEFINSHLGEDLSLERLAQEVNYSVYYICRIFKKVTNYTLTNYIIEKRIEKAAYYLKGSNPITEIAENTGFNNYSYFYKTFKRTMSMSPAEYREANS